MRQEKANQSSSNFSGNSLIILYDNIRWEEKTLYEAAKKKGINVENVDCKNLVVDLNDKRSNYKGQVVLQRLLDHSRTVTPRPGIARRHRPMPT